jgi:hypothetical protein
MNQLPAVGNMEIKTVHPRSRLILLTSSLGLAVTACVTPLVLFPTLLPNAAQGSFYSEFITTDSENDARWDVESGSLPPGLSLNSSTGRISGTPTSSGQFEFTVVAREPAFFVRTGARTYSLFVIERLQVATTLTDARVNQSYSVTPSVSGGVPPYTYEITGLPAGLNYDSETGIISGTPINAVNDLELQVSVTDSGNPQQLASVRTTLSVKPPSVTIATTSLADGKAGEAYSQTLQASDGTPSYTWAVVNGLLPDGLSLDLNSGVISGTPTKEETATFTVQVTDNDNPPTTDTQEFSVEIGPPAVRVRRSVPPVGKVGESYQYQLEAADGAGGYTWEALDDLPEGLSLEADTGLIQGVPTSHGETTFRVQVIDASDAATATTLGMTIEIQPNPVMITTESLEPGRMMEDYSVTLAATGGITSYQWSFDSGSLPAGLEWDGSTATISGTPTKAQESVFVIKVTDSAGTPTSDMQELKLLINPEAVEITTELLPSGQIGNNYDQQLIADLGAEPYTWEIIEGSLPDGLELDGTTGRIKNSPETVQTSTFKVQVTDSSNPPSSDTRELAIEIKPKPVEIVTVAHTLKVNQVLLLELQAQYGTPPYNWGVSDLGGLDLEVALAPDGEGFVLTGVPKSEGVFTFTLSVTDSGSPSTTDEVAFELTVEP